MRVVSDVAGAERDELLKRGRRGSMRGLLMEMLYRHGGLNQREIGEFLGVDYSAVSVARKRYRLRADKNQKASALAAKIEDKMSQE